MYILARYSPITPILNNCTLLKKKIGTTVDAQPSTVARNKAIYNAQKPNTLLTKKAIIPIKVIILSGKAEKDVIPSTAKANILPKGYLDWPANRSCRE